MVNDNNIKLSNQDNKYEVWKSITEADYVSMFIKTWFAFVSTLMKLHPDGRNLRGDAKYIKLYKQDIDKYYETIVYNDIKYEICNVYKEGLNIIALYYHDRFKDCFYRINNTFKHNFVEDEFVFSVKKAYKDTLKIFITSISSKYRDKIDRSVREIKIDYSYKHVIKEIENEIKRKSDIYCSEDVFIDKSYKSICSEINKIIYDEITNVKSKVPLKNNKRLHAHIDEMYTVIQSQIMNLFSSPQIGEIENNIKLIYQKPIGHYVYRIEDGETLDVLEQKQILLWFISFVYQLRNALFHEIIDPLDPSWQNIFKNSYLVLKNIVDCNIKCIVDNEIQ